MRGWAQAAATIVTAELAYVVEVERYRAEVGASEEVVPVELRVTSIFRPEEGTWRIVHRHADPITAARLPESVVQR
jgi:ketosteroid isomerase-like protein